jgi:glutathione S-transferase
MDRGFDIRCRRGRSLGGHEYNACRGDLGRYGMVEALLKRSELVEGSMYTLYHHPFCPHSRFVRLVLGEYGLDLRLVEERAWERREDFLALNPAGSTPVLTVDGLPPVPGVSVIAEFIDDACGAEAGDRRLMPADLAERIEVRRLMDWFNEKFFEEASNLLVTERIYKRFMSEEDGGGPPATDVIRAAKTNVRYHLAYIGWLAQRRNFLAGDRLTYADLAAAAHLSAIDYLGDVPWIEDDAAKAWYARVKSRPSFRPLLSDWLAGVPASRTYVDLDF